MKVFGKVESERILVWKVWDHAIDVKEDFKPSKAKVYLFSRNERGGVEICQQASEERVHKTLQTPVNIASILCRKEEWGKIHGYGLL